VKTIIEINNVTMKIKWRERGRKPVKGLENANISENTVGENHY
jgi:hypothetical protein